MQIGIVGSRKCPELVKSLSLKLGMEIGKLGFTLVNGGLGGVMRYSAMGCKKKGGTTVGIIPGMNRGEGNEFLDAEIVTGIGNLRNGIIVRSSDIVIALGGGAGTLSEIALAIDSGKEVLVVEEVNQFPGIEKLGAKILNFDEVLNLLRSLRK